jgi:L-lactate dehydrogenase complex protein LldE
LNPERKRVTLFVTCLADLFFPPVGIACVEILEHAGFRVLFPEAQTCCGQPAFNTGYRETARKLALRFLDVFEGDSPVVIPSGSCATMVTKMYPVLFRDDPQNLHRARTLAARVFELSRFLDRFGILEGAELKFDGQVSFHDACHGLRELGVRDEPRRLIQSVRGVTFRELDDAGRCCGFGGTFTMKHPGISGEMLTEKVKAIRKTRSDILLANDVSCLMHIQGALSRQRVPIRTMHLAEFLHTAMENARRGREDGR